MSDDPAFPVVIAGLDPAIQGRSFRICRPWMPGSSPGHDEISIAARAGLSCAS
jgi:hypothetical protein